MKTSELINVDMDEESLVLWSELPYDLNNDILAWLPLPSLCTFSEVCSEWSALFSSTEFISNEWAKAIPNRRPLLVVCSAKLNLPSIVYSFFTRTWKTFISFNFLQGVNHQRPGLELCYCGCVDGLFLLATRDHPFFTAPLYQVCNPLTRKSLQLSGRGVCPQTYKVVCIGFDKGTGEGQRTTYKVVSIGELLADINVHIVEIYDSSDNRWRIAGEVDGNIRIIGEHMIICNGFIYTIAVHIFRRHWNGDEILGILRFNMTDGTSNFNPMRIEGRNLYTLFTCRSRVFVAGRMFDNELRQDTSIIIWELIYSNSGSLSLAEIARMPLPMFEKIRHDTMSSECKSVDDSTVCFIFYRGLLDIESEVEVALYNIDKTSWEWLPSSRMSKPALHSVAFEVRPNIKVYEEYDQ